jgi:small neutral amino acid transporter SnatA (MarC family)
MGLILAAVAAQFVIDGLTAAFPVLAQVAAR